LTLFRLTLKGVLTPLGHWKKDDNPAEVVRAMVVRDALHLLAKDRSWIDPLNSNAGFNSKDLAPAMGSS